MTSARIVIPGQAMAMIPTMVARAPRRIRDVDIDLNMTGTPFVGSSPHRAVCYANLCRPQWMYCRPIAISWAQPDADASPRGLLGVIPGAGQVTHAELSAWAGVFAAGKSLACTPAWLPGS